MDGFEVPLKNIARYLGMDYLATYFHYAGENKAGKDFFGVLLKQFMDAIRG